MFYLRHPLRLAIARHLSQREKLYGILKVGEWMKGKTEGKVLAALALAVVLVSAGVGFWWQGPRAEQAKSPVGEGLTGLRETTEDAPAAFAPLLSWDKDTQAVVYEIEFYSAPDKKAEHRIYTTRAVYTNHYNAPLREIAGAYLGKQPLYWRVRSIGFDGQAVSKWSKLATLYTSEDEKDFDRPVAFSEYGKGNGSTLLYPVYDWVGIAGAAGYTLELYAGTPAVAAAGKLPPVATMQSAVTEIYDGAPRIGTFSWRVRAVDASGAYLGEWSDFYEVRAEPSDGWTVAVLGDSISHGGGHYSYSPADFEFSWLSYLDFPAINLSSSGDLSSMTRERFERDVLPFHPHYLMIFTGTNSLRAGVDPGDVIRDLEEMKVLALAHGIRPIFLTLPPINPRNIQHVFDEPTTPDWQQRFDRVNDYIREQACIDAAAAFVCPDGVLPTELALDGLHPDVDGKKLIGERVNEEWSRATADAEAQYRAYVEDE